MTQVANIYQISLGSNQTPKEARKDQVTASAGEHLRGSCCSSEIPLSWNISLKKGYYIPVKSAIPRYAGDKRSH